MAVPPLIVATARAGWHWQWQRLMQGLAPADAEGHYRRPASDRRDVVLPEASDLLARNDETRARLIIGRSCPWAHRTWLVHRLRGLGDSLTVLMATADHRAGRWQLDPAWLGCSSLLDLYRACSAPPSHLAAVAALVDPQGPRILGNESAQLVELLHRWPAS
jgi:putative glutathione S-transferase